MHLVTRTTAVAGLAVLASLAGTATAGSGDKATGGGQILLSNSGHGPGDTITFTAQERPDGTVVGNVNLIDRVGDGSGKGVHFRGDVVCIEAVGNVAKIAGVGRDGAGNTSGFTLVVTDNGEGAVADDDTIAFQLTDDVTCAREDGDDDSTTDLARGNAQVRDGGA